jgi:hypothetical protein
VCAVAWKTKQALRNSVAKGNLAYKASLLSGSSLSVVGAEAILLDSYSETYIDAAFSIYAVFPPTPAQSHFGAVGQAITMSVSKKLSSMKFWLKKYGNPDCQLVVRVYAATGTVGVNAKPTGEALAESDLVNASGLSSAGGLVEFTFSGANKISLVSGQSYCFLVLCKSATLIDGSNYFDVWVDSSSPAHAGNNCVYYDGAWAGSAYYDSCFYLYGV